MIYLTGCAAFALVASVSLVAATPAAAQDAETADLRRVAEALEEEIVLEHGEHVRTDLRRGLDQVLALWRRDDGDSEAFAALVRTHFMADALKRDAMFVRLQDAFEQLDGLLLESVRQLRMHVDVDRGEVLPFDRILAAYDPSAHVNADLFENQLAFIVLLNFPLTRLEDRLAAAGVWTRRDWAEARLAQRFGRRIPAEVNQAASEAAADADAYISEYNIWMHHLVDDGGRRLFPPAMRLISHWNLRDEIRASYGQPEAYARQRVIQRVMERIVTQTIPSAVIDDPRIDWNPFTNVIRSSTVVDYDTSAYPALAGAPDSRREQDIRYETLLSVFHAATLMDPYSPGAPSAIRRAFDERRELPEERVREIFESVLTSSHVAAVARLIEQRMGRPLEPFDIWYDGFKARGAHGQEELNRIVSQRYPDAATFRADVPRILRDLGFGPELANYLADNIEVHPSRGAGHAWGGGRRGDPAFLRTRIESGGMDYKGYNIAVHELGHNVEQVLSLNHVDHTQLAGVPNNAFTEALAFVFQERDLELLGLSRHDPLTEALNTIDTFWNTFEIAGVALVDMAVWEWMYANPDATGEDLRDATVQISRDVWNRYYAPVLGQRDSPLLGIYSHMISYPLYLADYPLGHLIAFQIRQQMKRVGAVGPEFVRVAEIGKVLPDLWMREATGAPVGAEALLGATMIALQELKRQGGEE